MRKINFEFNKPVSSTINLRLVKIDFETMSRSQNKIQEFYVLKFLQNLRKGPFAFTNLGNSKILSFLLEGKNQF